MMRYEERTDDVLVRVQPSYSLADSAPEEGRFVFTYQVELENVGDESVQLLFRHWKIHDSGGEDSEVNGEGVVGQQPLLAPGDGHRYRSYCVLNSPAGHMEGHYVFQRPDGSRFQARVPKFTLSAYLPGPDEPQMH